MKILKLLFIGLFFVGLTSCGGDDEPDEGVTKTVIFYTNQDWGCGPIEVTFDGRRASNNLESFFPTGSPQCDSGFEVSFGNVALGDYTFSAITASGCRWQGNVNVNNTDDCTRFAINESHELTNICSTWENMPPCLEIIGIDTISMMCSLGNNMAPRMTVRNNCDEARKVVLCRSTSVAESTNSPEGIEPGEEDTFIQCAGFDGTTVWTIDKTISDEYNCSLSIQECN